MVAALILVDLGIMTGSVWILARKGTVGWRGGFEIEDAAGPLRVEHVDPGGNVAAVLRPGDRVVAIDGDRRVDPRMLWLFGRVFASGTRVTVERDGQELDVALPPLAIQVRGPVGSLLSAVPPGIALMASGAAVGLVRPDLRAARLFTLAALISVAPVVTHGARVTQDAGALAPWENWFTWLSHLPAPLHLVMTLAFLYAFPARPALGPGWRRLCWATAAGGVLAWLASVLLDVATDLRPDVGMFLAWNHPALWLGLNTTAGVYPGLAFAVMALIVFRKYRGTAEVDERRRLKWMVAGAVAGLLPLSIYFLVEIGFWLSGADLPGWLGDAAFALVTVLPVAVSYAVARHQLFDIQVVVRRGLQYLLARNVLRALLILPFATLGYAVLSNPNRTLLELLVESPWYLGVIAALSVSLRFRREMLNWLDRKFFREAYDRERILLRLIADLDKLDSIREIGRLVSAQVEFALHPRSIYVWYQEREGESLALAYGSGAHAGPAEFPLGSRWAQLAGRDSSAVEVPPPEGAGLGNGDRHRLDELGVRLVVPVMGDGERPCGLLMLGEKKSEEPYTVRDRELLEAIAKQMALVCEHLRLKERRDEERQITADLIARFSGQPVNLLKECPRCGTCFDSVASSCDLDGHELILSLPVERIVDGKYRLDRLIGRGGMGAVYEAHDQRLDRKVAVKIVLGRSVRDVAPLRRFEREARAVARLNHPNIVTLFDYGRIPTGGAYLVMERLEGVTLRAELQRRGALPAALAADWFDQILEGLKLAHEKGVVHRDLKPENILVVGQPAERARPVLLDFGLAKMRALVAPDPRMLTTEGVVLGTLGYMSPEQLTGLDTDERTDVFSLGVMLVEALTGQRPFPGTTHVEVLISVLHESFELPGTAPEIRRLNDVLQRCLTREMSERYRSAAALQSELIPAIRSCASVLTYVGAAGRGETASSVLTTAPVSRPQTP